LIRRARPSFIAPERSSITAVRVTSGAELPEMVAYGQQCPNSCWREYFGVGKRRQLRKLYVTSVVIGECIAE
jgi:hypothetical protein